MIAKRKTISQVQHCILIYEVIGWGFGVGVGVVV
jgi:hypothetical protein